MADFTERVAVLVARPLVDPADRGPVGEVTGRFHPIARHLQDEAPGIDLDLASVGDAGREKGRAGHEGLEMLGIEPATEVVQADEGSSRDQGRGERLVDTAHATLPGGYEVGRFAVHARRPTSAGSLCRSGFPWPRQCRWAPNPGCGPPFGALESGTPPTPGCGRRGIRKRTRQ